MTHYETRKSRETIYKGTVFSVYQDMVELENGCAVPREVVEHHGGAAVLAINEEGKIALVRQYRYGAGKELLELPAGKLDEGEDPQACAVRELQEETGFRADSVEHLGEIHPTPAYDTEVIYIYQASGLTYQGQHLDDDEFLSVSWIPLEETIAMCLSGEITDAKSVAGILLYAGRKLV